MSEQLQTALWMLPTVYFAAALLAVDRRIHTWRVVYVATRLSLGTSLAIIAAVAWTDAPAASTLHSVTALLLTTLIAFLGWIIGEYSSRYLQGEPGQRRFVIAFLFTLASVTSVVVSTHFAIVILAWSLSSAGLHHLLTFYRDRSTAILVAHKKFLASRLAEICLILAALLLYGQWHTLNVPRLMAHVAASPALPMPAAAAAVLISAAVLIKSAQLPVHGWLIQVMEAPTPVSALLHAGIVNLGAYVLIQLSPLIASSIAAQTLLVLVGGLTACLAGLVMMTRVTIKVRLAWSTCSQMGFTMMECGLGLYDLALLHVLGHAVYKAHAFLTAGETVRTSLERALLTSREAGQTRMPVVEWLLSLALASGLIISSARLWQQIFGTPAVSPIATAILACGLATLLWPAPAKRFPPVSGIVAVFVVTQMYLAWHALLAGLFAHVPPQPANLLAICALAMLVALYFAQGVFSSPRRCASTDRLYRWVHGGFYLDEHFTRLTFRIWPVRTTN